MSDFGSHVGLLFSVLGKCSFSFPAFVFTAQENMQNSGGIGPDDRPLYHFEFYDHVSMFDPEANSVFTFKLEPQTLYPIVLDKSRSMHFASH